MAKLNLAVFKQGKPIYWIVGAVVVFVLFYLMLNKGGSSSGATSYVATGPSEAMQAQALQAGTAIQGAQIAANIEALRIQAGRETALAGATVASEQLASGERVAMAQLSHDTALANLNAQANMLINEQNIEYGIETARLAADTQLGLRALDIGLLQTQLETQAHMFQTQSTNLIAQSLIGQVGNLKKKNRDEALAYLASASLGTPNTYAPQGGINIPIEYIPSVAGYIA